MRWVLLILLTYAQASLGDGFVRLRSKQGACLYWGRTEVRYQLTAGGPGGRAFAPPERAAFQRAFERWKQVAATCSDLPLELMDGERTDRAVNEGGPNTIVMRERRCDEYLAHPDACEADADKAFGLCSTKYDCWYEPEAVSRLTLAVTTTLYVPKTGRITEADITFMGAPRRDGTSNVFTTSDMDVVNDLQSILTHELGHALGFAHTLTPGLMFEALPVGSTAIRDIDEGSRAGFCEVYGTGATVACTAEQALSLPPPRIIARTEGCAAAPAAGGWMCVLVLAARRRRLKTFDFSR